jgi:hypothetical protein
MDKFQLGFKQKNVETEAYTKVIKSTDLFGHNYVESIIFLKCFEMMISRREKLSPFICSNWLPFQL